MDVDFLTAEKKTADLFEQTAAFGCPPKEVSNWIMGDLMKLLKDRQTDLDALEIDPKAFARMIALQQEGRINRNAARQLLDALLDDGVLDPDAWISERHLEMTSDEDGIRRCAQEVLTANAQSVRDYRGGKEKAFSFLVGQVMRQMKGKADPAVVNTVLKEEVDRIECDL